MDKCSLKSITLLRKEAPSGLASVADKERFTQVKYPRKRRNLDQSNGSTCKSTLLKSDQDQKQAQASVVNVNLLAPLSNRENPSYFGTKNSFAILSDNEDTTISTGDTLLPEFSQADHCSVSLSNASDQTRN